MNVYSANEEIVKVKRSSESEVARLQAAARKAEMQVQSLEQTIEQKAGSSSLSSAFIVSLLLTTE